MIKEIAILNVRTDETKAFELAMAQAKPLITSMPGFVSMEVRRCIENNHRYLLEVIWKTLEDHTEGFRGSPDYQRWQALLHHFYEPFPTVEHYGKPIISS